MVSDKALKVEVLAPAGSLDICKAVINAGADAVYLGGDMFGARAFAGNLNKEELIEAIEYAHTFGRKIYLTVNTLLKEDEINNQLIDYLIPYYEAGLDAVIVQDFGVFSLIRKHFPDMDIHASTQMTQTGPNGARLLKEMGATRVVTSRELTIEEIRHLHNEVEDIEIESFVHGALCYCYSGQCLMSSFNGTRSGNRGRCAQPCRMAYQAYDRDVLCNDKSSEYVLSLKDMCALPILPDVIEAGVYSLKIEGRMKNVTYAAFVTSMYRKYVDMYIKNGRNGYRVSDDDIRSLMDIYNRGAFTTGYYNSDKGRDMISLSRPNHYGVPALKVLNNVNGRVTFRALIDINSQDVFEIDKDNSFASGSSVKKNETLVVNLPKKYPLFKGKVINRMNNSRLKTFVEDNYISVSPKVVLDMEVIAHINKPFEVLVKCEGQAYRYIGEEVGNAVKQPLTRETVEKNMSGLGDTFYTIGKLIVSMDDNIFLSVGQLKKARREAVFRLHQLRLDFYKRKYNKPYNNSDKLRSDTTSFQSESKKCVYLKNTDFIDTVISCGANEIYLDYQLVINSLENVKKAVCTCKDNNVSVYIMLPYILSDDKLPVFCDLLNECEKLGIFGFVCRNLEEIGYISKWSEKIGQKAYVVLDSGLYIYNSCSKDFLREILRLSGINPVRFTLPYELNYNELLPVADIDTELIVYSKPALMVSKQCTRKTFSKCDKSYGKMRLKGFKDNTYSAFCECDFCYQTIVGKKVNLLSCKEIKMFSNVNFRYEFDDETKEEIERVLSFSFDESKELLPFSNSYGHFYRGVD